MRKEVWYVERRESEADRELLRDRALEWVIVVDGGGALTAMAGGAYAGTGGIAGLALAVGDDEVAT